MNIFTNVNRNVGQFLAVVTAFAMIMSALPIQAMVAEATIVPDSPYGDEVMKKIVLCHWDASAKPEPAYKSSGDVSVNAAINSHGSVHSEDIVPPFYYDGGYYPGLNWTPENVDIWGVEGSCDGADPVDMCPNIEGNQETVPEGLIVNEAGDCVEPPVDMCPNIEGNQETVPEGLIVNEAGDCVEPPVDQCPNLDGVQTEIPEGFEKNNEGNCVEKPRVCEVVIYSDTSAYVVEKDANAQPLTFVHPEWTASIPGATWIWGDDPVVDPTVDETQTFVNKFGFVGNVSTATLEIASDNTHAATLNAAAAGSSTDADNFHLATQDSYDVTGLIAQGNNELEVVASNIAVANSNPASNPAGVLYRLVIEGTPTEDEDCKIPYEEPPVCEDPDATNYGKEGDCVYPPETCEDEDALNYGEEGDCEYPEPVCEIGENLLSNGSFEDPTIKGSWTLTDVTDWVSTKVSDGTSVAGEIWNGLFGAASDGEQNVELGSTEATMITQNVATVEGATYELRFDFSARPNTNLANNEVAALVDGNPIMSASADGSALSEKDWSTYSETFVAGSESTDISFRDEGTNDSLGSLVDNAVLCYVSDPVGDPYCGDGKVNQEWEQCEVGDEGCTDYCLYENQCHTEQLVKITLEDTESKSFDGMIYLGSDSNTVPSGVWFNFNELGDATAQSLALGTEGLGVERDTTTGELKLAFQGGNSSRVLDNVVGVVNLIGSTFNGKTGFPGDFALENSGVGQDDFTKDSDTQYSFHMRADTGKDGVAFALLADEEPYDCPVEELACELSVSPNKLGEDGGEVELTWTTTAADYVEIDQGIGSGLNLNDSTTTSVTEETVFTLTAWNNQEESVECTAKVKIEEDNGGGGGGGSSRPYCEAFDADVDDGEITLTWETRRGSDLTIDADGEEIYSEDDNDVVDEGSLIVEDEGQEEFELTVSRGSRSDTCLIEMDRPEGEVAGEQVSIVPNGAPDTGAGGAALPAISAMPYLLAALRRNEINA